METSRRQFCKSVATVSLIGAAGSKFISAAFAASNNTQTEEAIMTFTLPPLPYAQDALEPYISANTLSFHYGKHHQGYVTKLNELVKDMPLASASLEEIIMATGGPTNATLVPEKAQPIFNNAAQVWNHTFYWSSMKPNGGGAPKGKLAKKIDADFGSFDKFKEEFKQAGATQFGSGWAWLVLEGDKLKVTKTPNADLPMVHNQKALLTMDVWEHAYYLDYQNKRPDYISTFLDHLANWDFAEQNLG